MLFKLGYLSAYGIENVYKKLKDVYEALEKKNQVLPPVEIAVATEFASYYDRSDKETRSYIEPLNKINEITKGKFSITIQAKNGVKDTEFFLQCLVTTGYLAKISNLSIDASKIYAYDDMTVKFKGLHEVFSKLFNENCLYLGDISVITDNTEQLNRYLTSSSECKAAYDQLLDILKIHAVTTENVQKCIQEIKHYAAFLTTIKALQEKESDPVYQELNDQCFENMKIQLQQAKDKLENYSEILSQREDKGNGEIYYYLADYYLNVEEKENKDYKKIFEYFSKVTASKDDPNFVRQQELYRKANCAIANLYYNQEQYVKIEEIPEAEYTKDDKGDYIFSIDMHLKQLKSSLKYAMEGQDYWLSRQILKDYCLFEQRREGFAVMEEDAFFDSIEFEGKDAFEVIATLTRYLLRKNYENQAQQQAEMKSRQLGTPNLLSFSSLNNSLASLPSSESADTLEEGDSAKKRHKPSCE